MKSYRFYVRFVFAAMLLLEIGKATNIVNAQNNEASARPHICMDGMAILHHEKSGKLKQLPFGGCGDELQDYYGLQVGPDLQQGWTDLARDNSSKGRELKSTINLFLQDKQRFPRDVAELESVGSEETTSTPEATAAATYTLSGAPVSNSLPEAQAALAAPPSSWTTGEKSLLVIVPYWSDHAAIISPDTALSVMKIVNDVYLKNSLGATSFNITVTPQILMPNLWSASGSNWNNCSTVAAQAGYDPKSYNLWLCFAPTGGAYAGVANIGVAGALVGAGSDGTSSGNRNSVRICAHELGHNFGLDHAGALIGRDGTSIPASVADISFLGAGDWADIMGYGNGLESGFNIGEREYLHWPVPKQSITTSGIYTINPFNESGVAEPGTVHSLSFTRPGDPEGRTYFLSTPLNSQTGGGPLGLSAHLYQWRLGGLTSILNNESTSGYFSTGGLSLGYTYTDPAADFHVTPIERSAVGVTPGWIKLAVGIGVSAENHAPTLSITQSANTVPVNGSVTFTGTGRDADGDPLVYQGITTDIGYLSPEPFMYNPTFTASFRGPLTHIIRMAASDMRGGTATTVAILGVGTAGGNIPPNLVENIKASPSDYIDKSSTLTVLAADGDGPEADLTYSWFPAAGQTYPGTMTLSENNSNAAKRTVLTFSKAGIYNMQLDVTDRNGNQLARNVFVSPGPLSFSVSVLQSPTTFTISPTSATISPGDSLQFSSTQSGIDQFGDPIATPLPVKYTVLQPGGLEYTNYGTSYWAPWSSTPGTYEVLAESGNKKATAYVTVTSQPSPTPIPSPTPAPSPTPTPMPSPTPTPTQSPSAPVAPSNLTALQISSAQINLSWTDNSNNESGFLIQRSTNGGKKWSKLKELGSNVTTYADTTVSSRSTYLYRVYAFNAVGNSAYSNPAAPIAAAALSTTTTKVKGRRSSAGAKLFRQERKK